MEIVLCRLITYYKHCALAHLEKPGSTIRIMFFDFLKAFNTIQPTLLKDKLERTGVDHQLSEWVLVWTHNTDALYRKGQSWLYLLRRLRFFGVTGAVLKTF